MPTYALALRNGESVAVEFPHDAYECQARARRGMPGPAPTLAC
jgi:hypothetical protein